MLYQLINISRDQGKFNVSANEGTLDVYTINCLALDILNKDYNGGDTDFSVSAYVKYTGIAQGEMEIEGIYLFKLMRLGNNILSSAEGDAMLPLFYNDMFLGNSVFLASKCSECNAIEPFCKCYKTQLPTNAYNRLRQIWDGWDRKSRIDDLEILLGELYKEIDMRRNHDDFHDYTANVIELIDEYYDTYDRSNLKDFVVNCVALLWPLPLNSVNRRSLLMLYDSFDMEEEKKLSDIITFGITQKMWADFLHDTYYDEEVARICGYMFSDYHINTFYVHLAAHIFDYNSNLFFDHDRITLVDDNGSQMTMHDLANIRLANPQPLSSAGARLIRKIIFSSRENDQEAANQLLKSLVKHSPIQFIKTFGGWRNNNYHKDMDKLDEEEMTILLDACYNHAQSDDQYSIIAELVRLLSGIVLRMHNLNMLQDVDVVNKMRTVVEYIADSIDFSNKPIIKMMFVDDMLALPIYDNSLVAENLLPPIFETAKRYFDNQYLDEKIVRQNHTLVCNPEALEIMWEYFSRCANVRKTMANIALEHGPGNIPPKAWKSLKGSKNKHVAAIVEQIKATYPNAK